MPLQTGANSTSQISGIASPQDESDMPSAIKQEAQYPRYQVHESSARRISAVDMGMLPKIPSKKELKKSKSVNKLSKTTKLNPSLSARSHAFDIRLHVNKKPIPGRNPLLDKDPRDSESQTTSK